MKKKCMQFICSMILIGSLLSGRCLEAFDLCCAKPEIKLGYFAFANAKMRKIYDQEGFAGQLGVSYPLCQRYELLTSLGFIANKGRSLGGHQKAFLRQVPLSLGLKALIPCNLKFTPYLILGPRYFFVHAHNNSSFVNSHLQKSALGGFLQGGLTLKCTAKYQFDAFAEYSYVKMHFHTAKTNVQGRTAQLGGYTIGASASWHF